MILNCSANAKEKTWSLAKVSRSSRKVSVKHSDEHVVDASNVYMGWATTASVFSFLGKGAAPWLYPNRQTIADN